VIDCEQAGADQARIARSNANPEQYFCTAQSRRIHCADSSAPNGRGGHDRHPDVAKAEAGRDRDRRPANAGIEQADIELLAHV